MRVNSSLTVAELLVVVMACLIILIGLRPSAIADDAEEKVPAMRPFRLGFTPFPWDYGEGIRRRSLDFVSAIAGDIILHHCDFCVPWPEALANQPIAAGLEQNWKGHPDKAFNTVDPAEYLREDARVYLALTPLNMGRNSLAVDRRGKAPEGFEEKEFDDPEVKRGYLNYCRRAIEHFNPDYLAIGIEVDALRANAPDRWPHLVELHRYVYDELKKDHPDLSIFATLTLHSLLNEEHRDDTRYHQDIKEFLKYNDLAGISFYSFLGTIGDPERPKEAFEWLRDFVGDKPIAITETGFPAEATDNPMWPQWPGSLEAQRTYFETLFEYAMRDNYQFIIVFLHRDYDKMWEKLKETRPAWQGAWKDIGLLDGDGSARPAWLLWQEYLPMELAEPEQDLSGLDME